MALTFVNSASWATAGTNSTGTLYYKDVTFTSVGVGDLLVVGGAAEGHNGTGVRAVATQSGTTGTWTLIQPEGTNASDADAVGASATATSSGTIVVRVSLVPLSGVDHMGACGWKIPASEWNSSGTLITALVSSTTDNTNGLLSLTLTTGTYIVVGMGGEWNGVTASTGSQPAGGTSNVAVLDTSHYTVFARSWTAQATGTRNYGPAATTTNATLSGLDYTGWVLAIPEATGGGAQTVVPTAVASGGALGAQVVTTTVTSAPTGLASGQALGTPVLSTLTTPVPTGIPSGAALGTPVLTTAATVVPGGVVSGAALGTPAASLGGAATVEITEMAVYQTLIVTPSGVATGAATGTPGATLGAPPTTTTVEIVEMSLTIVPNVASQTVVPSGVPTGAAAGTPTLSTSGATVEITGMAIGIGTLSGAFVEITEMSVAINASPPSPQTVTPAGVASGALVGTPGIGTGATVEITNMVITIATAAALYVWQERVAGAWVDPDWVWMERRAGVWEPLDS